jgi:hypothetical protein
MGIPLALDFGLAVYPDDGELQEVLIRVADERLYQLKNGVHAAPRARPAPAEVLPPQPPKQEVPPAPKSSAEAPAVPTLPNKDKDTDRRRWERVSLAKTHAYALIGEGVEMTARVIDLGYGGVALETNRPGDFSEDFHAVLHVPILPPVRVNLHRVYQGPGDAGATRIGCSFVT